MEEAPENGKESLHAAHVNGMDNEWIQCILYHILIFIPMCFGINCWCHLQGIQSYCSFFLTQPNDDFIQATPEWYHRIFVFCHAGASLSFNFRSYNRKIISVLVIPVSLIWNHHSDVFRRNHSKAALPVHWNLILINSVKEYDTWYFQYHDILIYEWFEVVENA